MGMIPWYVFAIGASFFATAFAILRKKALQYEHPLEFESVRVIAVAGLLLLLLPWVAPSYPLNVIGIVYFVSLLGAIGIFLMAKSYKHMQISYLYPLASIKPVFVLVLAYFFLSETVNLKNAIGIFVIFFAAYALEADHHWRNILLPFKLLFSSRYNIYLISAISIFSVTALFDKYIISTLLDPVSFLFLVWIFIAFNLNIFHGMKYGFGEVKTYLQKTTYLPFIVAFCSVGANLLYLFALQKAYVSLVTPVVLLSTLFVVFVGGQFFKEDHVWYRFFVSFIMLVGVYLVIT